MGTDAPPRIVVGVNGSPPSLAALRWAAGEARLRGTRLHVVYVWDRSQRRLAPYARRGGRLKPAQERMVARARLTVAVRAAFGRGAPEEIITTELAEGLVARVLLDRAADAELLVLGAPGPRSHADLAAGPVARACLGQASCPVVVVNEAVNAAGSGAENADPRGPGRAAVTAQPQP
jgi:nucleotide-binding universal stress UspA family protein